MSSTTHLPVRSNPEDRQVRQQPTARRHSPRVYKMICAIFLALLFLVGIIVFILWLSFRPHRPKFHVRGFLVPGLDKAHGFENARVIFNVTDRNPNRKIGIYYDAMQVTLFYKGQSIGGTSLSFPFYQEPKNTTMLSSVLGRATLTVNNQRWMEFRNDLTGGMVVFRIRITSTIRFKVSKWDTKSHRMHANCKVGVGPDGSILASYKDKRCPVYFTS
ncbi:hypothetical protein U1Q18_008953 [Sarracenia purpurea var. burkii]